MPACHSSSSSSSSRSDAASATDSCKQQQQRCCVAVFPDAGMVQALWLSASNSSSSNSNSSSAHCEYGLWHMVSCFDNCVIQASLGHILWVWCAHPKQTASGTAARLSFGNSCAAFIDSKGLKSEQAWGRHAISKLHTDSIGNWLSRGAVAARTWEGHHAASSGSTAVIQML
jgi:hypothetical protein